MPREKTPLTISVMGPAQAEISRIITTFGLLHFDKRTIDKFELEAKTKGITGTKDNI